MKDDGRSPHGIRCEGGRSFAIHSHRSSSMSYPDTLLSTFIALLHTPGLVFAKGSENVEEISRVKSNRDACPTVSHGDFIKPLATVGRLRRNAHRALRNCQLHSSGPLIRRHRNSSKRVGKRQTRNSH